MKMVFFLGSFAREDTLLAGTISLSDARMQNFFSAESHTSPRIQKLQFLLCVEHCIAPSLIVLGSR